MNNLELFKDIRTPQTASPVNVASVPQRSPFRYPGGKTWLIPVIRKWLRSFKASETTLVDCFGGGGIVSLTAAFENRARHIVMIELDADIAAVWKTILGEDNKWLANKIFRFDLALQNVEKELTRPNQSIREAAFCTILRNRIFHGGIMAKGSGLIKHGENGKGIASRWYPKTIRDRILAIHQVKEKISFFHGDIFKVFGKYADKKDCCFFIDPPYTVAGRRLYTHHQVDHAKLFDLTSRIKGNFLMTYDDSEEIRDLASKFNFPYEAIPMKTTHHRQKNELLISNKLDWLN
ncbi:MAG: DNA adenine methylase [Deltaproteobacteria bacterium]|nr:DNA adenine methylase [Deltaproteobacteria bacterium]